MFINAEENNDVKKAIPSCTANHTTIAISRQKNHNRIFSQDRAALVKMSQNILLLKKDEGST